MPETESTTPDAPPTAEMTTIRILIVDDSDLQAKAVAKLFVQIGCKNVALCSDPFQVIPILKQGQTDIVFCDWNMPGCTGVEIFREIKKEPDLNAIPFVVLTANNQKEHVIQALRSGIKEYIVKPATKEILRTKLALVQKPSPAAE